MAQVEMPKGNAPVNREYNNRPTPIVNYDVTGSNAKPKKGFAKWWDDVWASMFTEIIKPTLTNLLYNMIVTGTRRAIFKDDVGGPGFTNYSGPVSNYNYNPNASYQYANRFNANDSFVNRNVQPKQAEDWRSYRYATRNDALKMIDSIRQRIYEKGYCDIVWYSDLAGHECDWTLGSYGWRNFDNYDIRYMMDGKTARTRDGREILIPYMLIPPKEEYLGNIPQ